MDGKWKAGNIACHSSLATTHCYLRNHFSNVSFLHMTLKNPNLFVLEEQWERLSWTVKSDV